MGISVSALISTATDPGGVTLTPSHDPLWHQADKTLPAQHQLRRHFTAVIYQNIKRINNTLFSEMEVLTPLHLSDKDKRQKHD